MEYFRLRKPLRLREQRTLEEYSRLNRPPRWGNREPWWSILCSAQLWLVVQEKDDISEVIGTQKLAQFFYARETAIQVEVGLGAEGDFLFSFSICQCIFFNHGGTSFLKIRTDMAVFPWRGGCNQASLYIYTIKSKTKANFKEIKRFSKDCRGVIL